LDSFLAPRRAPPFRTSPLAGRIAAMQPDPRGEQGAELLRLYAPLAPALHAWACMRLRPDDRRTVQPEDLTQEVWLRAFAVFPAFDATRSSFRAWLFAVAKNVLLELRRQWAKSRREQPAHGSSSRLLALDQVPLEVTSVTRRVAKDEQVRSFVQKLQELPAVDQQTVLHCGIEALPLAAAAARLGESYDATAKRWSRLRERLRTWAGPLGLFTEE
jgi:RNA polymerase sigma factor (sigma-70 family)